MIDKKKKTNKKSRLHSRKNQGTPKKIKRKKNKTLKKGGAKRSLAESRETDSDPFRPHLKRDNFNVLKSSLRNPNMLGRQTSGASLRN